MSRLSVLRLALFTLIPVSIRAQQFFQGSNLGAASGGARGTQAVELVTNANHNPNSTRSVRFNPLNDDDEWTWRVNVTDFSIPRGASTDQFADPHVTNTAYDLRWPNGGTLESALNGSSSPLCFSIFDGALLPNITSLYNDTTVSSTDCAPIFGQECTSAILTDLDAADGSTCPGPTRSWSALPECAFSFGASRAANLATGSGSTGLDGDRRSGAGIFSTSTDVHDGSNTTAYQDAASQLQVMLLRIPVEQPRGSDAVVTIPQLLCMRVNTTNLATATEQGPETSSPAGSSTGGSTGGSPSQTGGAGMTEVGATMLAGAMGIGALLGAWL